MPASPSRLIRVGRVAGAFGVKGEARITAFTEDPLSLLAYSPLLDKDGAPFLTLTAGRAQKGALIARAREIPTREAAEAMRGAFLYIPRERLPAPDDDEFYLTDLIGLAAVSPDGEALGTVKSVRDFGAGDILEIQPPGGASWLVAFTRENIPQIDLEGARLVVVRPTETSVETPAR